MDVCVATCSLEDIAFLDLLLRSLGAFADLAHCDLLVSHNSPDPHLHKMLTDVCQSHPAKSLSIDFFKTKETQGSQQHGEALNRLVARTTSKHVVVVDPDVIITSPQWLDFCKRHIDEGCFIVGTPYGPPRPAAPGHSVPDGAPKSMWQGDFPNVWCAMIDGDILREAKLDMRPWDANATEPDGWTWSHDTSWRMAEYGLRNNLKYIPFSMTSRLLRRLLRKWSAESPRTRMRQHIGRAAVTRLDRLRTFEFAFPGTDEACCMHLGHGDWRRCRAKRWVLCASTILDACAAAPVQLQTGATEPRHQRKQRSRMTRVQRRGRRRRGKSK